MLVRKNVFTMIYLFHIVAADPNVLFEVLACSAGRRGGELVFVDIRHTPTFIAFGVSLRGADSSSYFSLGNRR